MQLNKVTWLLAVLVFVFGSAQAGDETHSSRLLIEYESEVFAQKAGVPVTQRDFDGYLAEVPPEHRAGTLADPGRIANILNALFSSRVLANKAIDDGMLEDDAVQAHVYHQVMRLVRRLYIEAYIEDNELDDYSTVARELYLTRPESFQQPERLDFEHVLVAVRPDDSELEKMQTVKELHEAITAEPERFGEIAVEASDDPQAENNQGRYEAVPIDQLDEAFAQSLRDMPQGEISEPIRTQFGWHIARLNRLHEPEVPDYEEVEAQALEMARNRHHDDLHDEALRYRYDAAVTMKDGAVETLLRRYGIDYTEEMEAADFEQ